MVTIKSVNFFAINNKGGTFKNGCLSENEGGGKRPGGMTDHR